MEILRWTKRLSGLPTPPCRSDQGDCAALRGEAIEEDGLLLAAGNHPCPVVVNSALRTGTMDATEALRRAEVFFGERRHRYETWTREGADADLEKAALAAGMHLAAELSGMILHHSPDVPQPRPDVEVRRVQDMEGVQDFINVAAEGFRDETPCLSDLVRATFSNPRSGHARDLPRRRHDRKYAVP